MRLLSLEVANYRNIAAAQLEPGRELTVICGNNGQGKTNLLEAIVYLSCGKSPRAHGDRELIGFDRQDALLTGQIFSRQREFVTDIRLSRSKRRSMTVNGVKAKNGAALSDVLHTVFFAPEDLFLIRAGAAERRRFMDMQLSQLRPAYFYALQRAVRTLNQRNALLKDIARNPSLLPTLDMWDEQLARVGAVICENRREAVGRLDELARAAHLSLTGGREELRLRYVSQVADAPDAYEALLARLSRARSEDLRRMTTTVGIHRDDIAITIDGKEARTFASQGQQRSAVLSLKLAQLELAGAESGEAPILMLDDVMSELDPSRRRQLIERIDRVQTFVTCTDLSDLAGARQGAVYRVENGVLTRE